MKSLFERSGKFMRIPGCDQDPGIHVAENLNGAACSGGDNRAPGHKTFDDHATEWLWRGRRVNDNVDAAHQLRDVGPKPEKVDTILDAETIGLGAKRFGVRLVPPKESVSDDQSVHSRDLVDRIEQYVLTFPRGESAEHSDTGSAFDAELSPEFGHFVGFDVFIAGGIDAIIHNRRA